MKSIVFIFCMMLSAVVCSSPIRSALGAERNNREPIPYDSEVEYIGVGEAIGPYIDTGYSWTTENIEIFIEFLRTAEPTANTGLFGSQKIGTDTNWGLQFWCPNPSSVQHYLGSTAVIYAWNPSTNVKYTFTGQARANHTWMIDINGDVHAGNWSGSVCNNVTTIGLFSLYNNVNMTGRRTNNVLVYSFRLVDDGIVVIDMIPVRFTNELGEVEGGMYDKVSSQIFRNQGTGAFLIGPDL